MADHEVQVHEVEFLSISNAKILEEPVVVITVRPDEGSFKPHNISIPRSQAKRLLEDLKSVLSRPTAFLMLIALVGFAGCSADVEVETQTTSPRPEAATGVLTTERSRTAVSIDLLRERRSVVMEDGRPADVPLGGTMVVEACVHLHEHLHVYLDEGDRRAERVAIEIIREWSNGDCGRRRRK